MKRIRTSQQVMLLETAQSKHVLLDNEVCHSGAKEVMTNRWELVINNNNNKKDQSNQQNQNRKYTYISI
jgi:hypothetical protein